MVRKSLIAAAFLLPLIALPGASYAAPPSYNYLTPYRGTIVQQIAPNSAPGFSHRHGPKGSVTWE